MVLVDALRFIHPTPGFKITSLPFKGRVRVGMGLETFI